MVCLGSWSQKVSNRNFRWIYVLCHGNFEFRSKPCSFKLLIMFHNICIMYFQATKLLMLDSATNHINREFVIQPVSNLPIKIMLSFLSMLTWFFWHFKVIMLNRSCMDILMSTIYICYVQHVTVHVSWVSATDYQ